MRPFVIGLVLIAAMLATYICIAIAVGTKMRFGAVTGWLFTSKASIAFLCWATVWGTWRGPGPVWIGAVGMIGVVSALIWQVWLIHRPRIKQTISNNKLRRSARQ